MAANFWDSHSSRALVTRQLIADSQIEDRARGLTEHHIAQVKVHFTQGIFDLAKLCKLRQRVAATAVVYFRTIYLRSNFCRVEPRLMFAGCLYLASKAEESLLAAKHLVTFARKLRPGWPYDVKHLLDAEMVIMEELNFNLVVFSPYRPLASLLRDAGAVDLAPRAWAALNDSYRTDLALLYPPHLLALGCLVLASRLAGRDLGPWLEKLNVDLNQVFDITMDLLTVYEKHLTPVPVDECDRLLDAVALKRPA